MSLRLIRNRHPLVHCITNTVVTNFSANGLLAVGASPIMADAIEEIEEIVQISDALLINIGTLHARTAAAMSAAIDAAKRKGIPVVLDPVGAGASKYRLETVRKFLETRAMTLIRCNAGELAAIAGVDWNAKGVDSGSGDADIEPIAREVAARYNSLVIVTGAADILTDGESVIRVHGGNEKITRITGTGCLLSALCAALLASTNEPLNGLEGLLSDYKKAAERALAPIGTYQAQFLNELERLSEVAS